MSEPEAALLKIEISKDALSDWLSARPAKASRWADWTDIAGLWYVGSEPSTLADLSQPELASVIADADAILLRFNSNRELLDLVLSASEAPFLKLAGYDDASIAFTAGTLTYSENLTEMMLFLVLARSAADHLSSEKFGLALVHNYIWGDSEEQSPTAAIRLLPDGESHFLKGDELESAAPAFQEIVDAMLENKAIPNMKVQDQRPAL